MSFRGLILLYIVLLFLQSCSKVTPCDNIEVFGHAAMGLSMPNSGYHANSMEAIDLALHFPSLTGIELDVRMSNDGQLWLYHNDFLEDETTGEG